MRSISFYSYQTKSCNTSSASLRNQLSHLCVARSRQVACSSVAEYAGKCNAPGCTKVTKCHLLKATRCAPLQASSRRPVCNYMFLFSFLLSSLFFSFIISRPPARMYVASKRVYRPADLFAIFRQMRAFKAYRYCVAWMLIIRRKRARIQVSRIPIRGEKMARARNRNIESLETIKSHCVEYFNIWHVLKKSHVNVTLRNQAPVRCDFRENGIFIEERGGEGEENERQRFLSVV